ncbi:MAG: hypothetical protein ICV67_06845, partial [Thermoleophilia bacterium]|nr:hypothetical protein [Thermoleophilia bacterium]
MTAETLRSQVETARLWVREHVRGNVTGQAVRVSLGEAERDAAAATSRFAGWDPRGETRAVRSEVAALGTDVTETLARLRIAAEDGRWDALPALARPLARLSVRLESAARRADP